MSLLKKHSNIRLQRSIWTSALGTILITGWNDGKSDSASLLQGSYRKEAERLMEVDGSRKKKEERKRKGRRITLENVLEEKKAVERENRKNPENRRYRREKGKHGGERKQEEPEKQKTPVSVVGGSRGLGRTTSQPSGDHWTHFKSSIKAKGNFPHVAQS